MARVSPIVHIIFQVKKCNVDGKDVDGISLMAYNFQNGGHSSAIDTFEVERIDIERTEYSDCKMTTNTNKY